MAGLKRQVLVAALVSTLALASAQAATCQNPAGFSAFLQQMRQDAAAAGVSQSAINESLNGVTLDNDVLHADHAQGVFHQSFEQFSGRMISAYRLSKGRALLKRYAPIFARIQRQYGVPGPIIVALWGLETSYGAFMGKYPTIRSIATLAFDCRRSPFFQKELIDAMRIVQRGYLRPSQMHGAWAGELGQTQFMPSSYLKFAVNYGGGGNLITSVPDVLASTGNYLHSYGWQAGQPWDPGTANFAVIQQWNKADVYSRTIALFADKLAGK